MTHASFRDEGHDSVFADRFGNFSHDVLLSE